MRWSEPPFGTAATRRSHARVGTPRQFSRTWRKQLSHFRRRRRPSAVVQTSAKTWDKLAEICGRYLGKGQQVAIEGRLQTRSWDDDQQRRHWKTEVVAQSVEMLSGRRKKDYAEMAADSLEAQALALGHVPASEPIPDDSGFSIAAGIDEGTDEEDLDDAEEAQGEEALAQAVA